MAIQRCLSQLLKNHISRQYILLSPTSLKHTFGKSHNKYSSDIKSRKYTHCHEWVTVEKDIGTVGISKYAQESLGDVVFAQLPDLGATIIAGEECGALESVKAASEIYSPVSGVVTEKNNNVEKKPSLINSSCYDKGWLFKLKLSKPEELDDLMTEAQYEIFLKTDVEKEPS